MWSLKNMAAIGLGQWSMSVDEFLHVLGGRLDIMLLLFFCMCSP